MITQMEVFTSRVTQAPLPVTDGLASTDPIQVRKIDGLGPVKAQINTGQYGSISGEYFRGSSRGKRNIVITVGLNPNWFDQTMESLRTILYSYFMPENEVKLRFTSSHMAQVDIEGIVESMEPNIFSRDPEIQVSIICPKPEFVGSSMTIFPGETLSLPDGTPTEIEYLGTLPTGVWVTIASSTIAPSMTDGEIRIINETPDNPVPDLFVVTASIDDTKYLELSTNKGNKYVRNVAVADGDITSLLGKNAMGSIWFELKHGLNKFRIMSTVPGLSWTLQYYSKYGGI